MQITRSNNTGRTLKSAPKPVESKPAEQSDQPADRVDNSAFSGKRDLTYAVGATLAQLPGPITNATGSLYGAPQLATSAIGGLMAAAGAREMMVNESFHGRINGAVHFAVGAMTAAAPWAGSLSIPLYVVSMSALGMKAMADQPGNILKTTAQETWAMAKEVTTGSWKP